MVPLVVQRLEKSKLDEIAKELGKETKTLVRELYPSILTLIIAWVNSDNAINRKTASHCFQELNEITNDVVKEQVAKEGDKIVTGLLLSLNETPRQNRFKDYRRL